MDSIYRTKTVDELTFTDNGMFQEVLRDPEICTELVERLLHVRVKRIEYPELEKKQSHLIIQPRAYVLMFILKTKIK